MATVISLVLIMNAKMCSLVMGSCTLRDTELFLVIKTDPVFNEGVIVANIQLREKIILNYQD